MGFEFEDKLTPFACFNLNLGFSCFIFNIIQGQISSIEGNRMLLIITSFFAIFSLSIMLCFNFK